MASEDHPSSSPPAPRRLFVSYSHKDAKWLARLRVHLRPVERLATIQAWDDTRIRPGERWRESIRAAVDATDIAILLISADFLASEYITSNELPPLLRAAADDGAMILPIIVGPSQFENTPALSCFQSLPEPGRPLMSLSRADQENVLASAAEHIRTSTVRLRRSAARDVEARAALGEQPSLPPPEATHLLAQASLSDLGLSRIYTRRSSALEEVADWIRAEGDEVFIVGTSLKGLFSDPDHGRFIQEAIREKAKTTVALKFLLTHPAFALLREKQESVNRRPEYSIAQEIARTVDVLRESGVLATSIKFFLGTPTLFAVKTSRFMLLNPYSYTHQALRGLSAVIRRDLGRGGDLYDSYDDSHFSGVWRSIHVEDLPGHSPAANSQLFNTDLRDVVSRYLDGKTKVNLLAKPSDAIPHDWLRRLNLRFRGEVEVYGQLAVEPEIASAGELELTPNQVTNSIALRSALQGKQNELHAMLADRPHWAGDSVRLDVQTLDFASVSAIRNDHLKPELLSASVVILCPDTDELIVHRRSADSSTFPGRLHTIGGSYLPTADLGSLLATVRREAAAETNLALDWPAIPPMIFAKEVETGFVQLVLLGIIINARDLSTLQGSDEGEVVRLSLSDLSNALCESSSWVPSGRAHLLAWLAIAAPRTLRIAGMSPAELFDTLVS